jgi:hypothetical protein
MCDQPVLAKRPFLAQCRLLLHFVPVLFVRARFGFKAGEWLRPYAKQHKEQQRKNKHLKIFFFENFSLQNFSSNFFFTHSP